MSDKEHSTIVSVTNIVLDRPAQTMAVLGTLSLLLLAIGILLGKVPYTATTAIINAITALTFMAAGYYFGGKG